MKIRAAIVVAGLVAWFTVAIYVTDRVSTSRIPVTVGSTINVQWGKFVGLEGLNK